MNIYISMTTHDYTEYTFASESWNNHEKNIFSNSTDNHLYR